MALVGDEQVLVAWIEVDNETGLNKLAARPLDLSGEPTGDVVVLEESDSLKFAGLSLSRVGRSLAALAYRRGDARGRLGDRARCALGLDRRARPRSVGADRGGRHLRQRRLRRPTTAAAQWCTR